MTDLEATLQAAEEAILSRDYGAALDLLRSAHDGGGDPARIVDLSKRIAMLGSGKEHRQANELIRRIGPVPAPVSRSESENAEPAAPSRQETAPSRQESRGWPYTWVNGLNVVFIVAGVLSFLGGILWGLGESTANDLSPLVIGPFLGLVAAAFFLGSAAVLVFLRDIASQS